MALAPCSLPEVVREFSSSPLETRIWSSSTSPPMMMLTPSSSEAEWYLVLHPTPQRTVGLVVGTHGDE